VEYIVSKIFFFSEEQWNVRIYAACIPNSEAILIRLSFPRTASQFHFVAEQWVNFTTCQQKQPTRIAGVREIPRFREFVDCPQPLLISCETKDRFRDEQLARITFK